MTTYRIMDGASGRPGIGSSVLTPPATATSASGGWLLGTMFTVSGSVMWLNGYYIYAASNSDITARKLALWNVYSSSGGISVLVANSTVTSGALTPSAWNYVPLATSIQLSPGDIYVAAEGWTATNGIELSSGQFGTGENYVNGITNGPLTCWPNTGSGGVLPFAWSTSFGMAGGMFSNALGADPAVAMPNNTSGSDLFWLDVLVNDTAPGGYAGSYRLHPNQFVMGGASVNVGADTANNFTLGIEFTVSQTCTVNNIWFYSFAALTQLPTEIGVYDVSGPTLIGSNTSPSWSGTAGAGWISAALTGTTLQPGHTYKAIVYNGAGSPAVWNYYVTDYWNNVTTSSGGWGNAGLTAGPLNFPSTAGATSPGQASYNLGPPVAFPNSNVGPFDYGLDIEVTPQAPAVSAPPSFLAPMRLT